jgi:hypothetical protein
MFWKDKNDDDFSRPQRCNDEKHIQNLAPDHVEIID